MKQMLPTDSSAALPDLPSDWPAGHPVPRTRVAPPTPPRLPCIASARNPSELQSFDTRVADILSGRPELLQLLKKHRAVFQNFNQDTIARLGRLLKQSHDSEEALEQQWYFSDSKNESLCGRPACSHVPKTPYITFHWRFPYGTSCNLAKASLAQSPDAPVCIHIVAHFSCLDQTECSQAEVQTNRTKSLHN